MFWQCLWERNVRTRSRHSKCFLVHKVSTHMFAGETVEDGANEAHCSWWEVACNGLWWVEYMNGDTRGNSWVRAWSDGRGPSLYRGVVWRGKEAIGRDSEDKNMKSREIRMAREKGEDNRQTAHYTNVGSEKGNKVRVGERCSSKRLSHNMGSMRKDEWKWLWWKNTDKD